MTMPGKSVLSRLRKPKIADDVPYAIHGIVRNGRSGVAIYHRGEMTAWGQNSTAAWESHHSAQAINRSLAKSDDWEVPVGHFEPALPRRRPNYGAGNTVGKRMTGAVTGVASPKKVQGTRVAARTASASMPKVGVMPTVNGRQLSPADVGKGLDPVGMARVRRELPRNLLISAGVGAGTGAATSGALHARAAHRRKTGRVGKGVLASQSARGTSDAQAGKKRSMLGNPTYRRAYDSAEQGTTSKRDRSYNPEASRQRRLGLAGGLTGVAGGAAIGSGVRDVRRDTGTLRGIDPGVVHVPAPPSAPRSKKRGASGRMERLTPEEHAAEQKDYNERLGHRTRRLETHQGLKNAKAVGEKGAVITRRSGGKLALGAGLLAAGGGISRYSRGRSNREWR